MTLLRMEEFWHKYLFYVLQWCQEAQSLWITISNTKMFPSLKMLPVNQTIVRYFSKAESV